MANSAEQQKINLINYFQKGKYTGISRKDKMAFNDNSGLKEFANDLREFNAEHPDGNYFNLRDADIKKFTQHFEKITNTASKEWQLNEGNGSYALMNLISIAAHSLKMFEDQVCLNPKQESDLFGRVHLMLPGIVRVLDLQCTNTNPLLDIVRLSNTWNHHGVDAEHFQDLPQFNMPTTLPKPTEELKTVMQNLASDLPYPQPDAVYGYGEEPTNRFFNQVALKLLELKKGDEATYNLVVERLDGDFPDLKFAEKVEALGKAPSGTATIVPHKIQKNVMDAPHIA